MWHIVTKRAAHGRWEKLDLQSRFRCRDQHTPTQHGSRGQEVTRGRGEGWALWGHFAHTGKGPTMWAHGLLLPQFAGFQCTSHGSLLNRDSSPRHVAFPQTSSCVVIKGCFPPIAAPGYFFLPVVRHGLEYLGKTQDFVSLPGHQTA